eukprot:1000996-Pyramimonas_sp.AAC.1
MVDELTRTTEGFSPERATSQSVPLPLSRLLRASSGESIDTASRVVPHAVVNVNLHWMRHAFSCANLLEVCNARWKNGLVSIRSELTPDPQLANIGVEQAKKTGNILHSEVMLRPDIVLCSGLTRAVETALFAFGPSSPYKGSVYPVPC